jgi:hypothetical protein
MGAIALDPEHYAVLKDIVDETYTDRIDVITEAWVYPDGQIQAFVTDEGRQLSVDIGEDISIFQTGEDASFTASFAGAKKRNCVKGIACGGTCIAKSKTCSKKSSKGQKAKAADLVAKTEKGKSKSKKSNTGKGAGGKIDSLGSFETSVLEAYKKIDKDTNADGLVPIHALRSALGDRVSRKDFDAYLLEMQGNDVFQLQGGSVPDSDPKKLEDSVQTELAGLRTYAALLEGGENKLTGEGPKSKPKSEPKPVKEDIKKLKSQKDFEPAIVKAYDDLNRDYKLDDLVPIHRLRAALGDRVSRKDFDDWMMNMNMDNKFDLGTGSGNKLQEADSIPTEFGIKFYASKSK